MARKRRRGRPRKANAKRRQTTREGRRTGRDPVDEGSPRLLQRKRRVGAGRADLELSGAAVLLAHDLISQQQYDRLGEVMGLLQIIARAWGQGTGSVSGLWSAIQAALSPRRTGGIQVPAGADAARHRLARRLRRLNGSRDLVVALAENRVPPPAIIERVLEDRLTGRDLAQLERLRAGLDHMM